LTCDRVISSYVGHFRSQLLVSDIIKVIPNRVCTVKWDDPVIIAALYLTAIDVETLLVLNGKKRVHGIIAAYNIINLIYSHPENIWKTLYKTSCYDVDCMVLKTSPEEHLDSLLSSMATTFLDYAVVEEASGHRVIGPIDVARLLLEHNVLNHIKGLRIKDIGSTPIVSLGEESSIKQLIGAMLRHKVRSVFIKEQRKVITDRDLIKYLLTSPVVDEFREDPNGVLFKPVKDVQNYMRKPAELEPETSLSEALKHLLSNEAYTIITTDECCIVTPWDIILSSFT